MKKFITSLTFSFYLTLYSASATAGIVSFTIGGIFLVGASIVGQQSAKEYEIAKEQPIDIISKHPTVVTDAFSGYAEKLGTQLKERKILWIRNKMSQLKTISSNIEKRYGKTIGLASLALLLTLVGVKIIF